jgi:hypothetical protein
MKPGEVFQAEERASAKAALETHFERGLSSLTLSEWSLLYRKVVLDETSFWTSPTSSNGSLS